MAINSVVQGSAADLIKVAMINVYNRMHASFAAFADTMAVSRVPLAVPA